jgi:hypothetical protein
MRQAEARRGHWAHTSLSRRGIGCMQQRVTPTERLDTPRRAVIVTGLKPPPFRCIPQTLSTIRSPIDKVITVQQSTLHRKASGPVVYGAKFQYPAPSSILPVGL